MPESERQWWTERHQRESAKHSCGHPRSVCADPERDWFPQLEVCYPTMARQQAQAKYERLHEKRPWHDGTFTSWAEKPSPDHPFHHSHGVTIWVAGEELGLGGEFLTSEQAGGDDSETEDAESGADGHGGVAGDLVSQQE